MKIPKQASKIDWDSPALKSIMRKTETETYLDGFDFSCLMARLLVSKGGYVIDTGNYENVNAEIARRLVRNIEKHPILWELFFMVA